MIFSPISKVWHRWNENQERKKQASVGVWESRWRSCLQSTVSTYSSPRMPQLSLPSLADPRKPCGTSASSVRKIDASQWHQPCSWDLTIQLQWKKRIRELRRLVVLGGIQNSINLKRYREVGVILLGKTFWKGLTCFGLHFFFKHTLQIEFLPLVYFDPLIPNTLCPWPNSLSHYTHVTNHSPAR